jgi:hypothetical protein
MVNGKTYFGILAKFSGNFLYNRVSGEVPTTCNWKADQPTTIK